MVRPVIPDERIPAAAGPVRDPADLEAELKKYQAIIEYMNRCGELSDVTDKFHHYEARWEALNQAGLARPFRFRMYQYYKKNSLNHLRMASNEIVRLLSQPKIIVHGDDFIRDNYQEPGFIQSMINGGKRLLGMNTDQPQQQQQQPAGGPNGRY